MKKEIMYQLKRVQHVSTDLQTCWDFFSSPANLAKITPKSMGFNVLTEVPDKMYPGLMIGYTVKPLLGIPLEWITEITHVEQGKYFVDEQRKGPYNIWHHEHHFEETEKGILMTDIVTYELPFGLLGKLVHPILVKSKLNQIFGYRFEVVEKMFNQ
jgi:ligand-binding SRPBCC domain-containing protein